MPTISNMKTANFERLSHRWTLLLICRSSLVSYCNVGKTVWEQFFTKGEVSRKYHYNTTATSTMANAAVATAAARASVDWLCNTDCSNGSTRRFFAACYRLERWLEFNHTGYAKQTHFYFSSCWHTDGGRDRSPNAEWVLITLVTRSPSSSRGSKDLCGCFYQFDSFV